jgi:hypothetical protein
MVRVPIFSYLSLKTASLSEHSKSLLAFGFPLDLRTAGTAHPLGEPLYVVEPGAKRYLPLFLELICTPEVLPLSSREITGTNTAVNAPALSPAGRAAMAKLR